MHRLKHLPVLALLLVATSTGARVVDFEIEGREDLPEGPWPAYERIEGTLSFATDPARPANARIVDLGYGPTAVDGTVRSSANVMILRPKDAADSSGVALVEVSNRGGKASLRYFNQAGESTHRPSTSEHLGTGLLQRLGLTVVWVGWQWDVPRDDPLRLRLDVPVARPDDGPIEGLVRADWVVDEATERLALAHRNHAAYEASAPGDPRNRLTRRTGRDAPRELIDPATWQFADDATITGRFEAGYIHELVYVAEDPRIVGLGPAAIRDTVSWLKHDAPAWLRVDHGIAFGVSQTGRFLRHFLYQGFNVDEQGRRAYDGMLIHTAGAGRGSFNHRFAQPSRDGHPYSAFLYPSDVFPFTSVRQTDEGLGVTDGLLATYDDPALVPRIVVTNTGYEYWGRAAGLIHTTPDGTRDVAPHSKERIYLLAGAQHFQDRWPPADERRLAEAVGWQGNPVPLLANLRALLAALVAWVDEDIAPPPSRYPRLADGSLVPLRDYRFPPVPGIDAPTTAHVAYRVDYGPRWQESGIIDVQPPRVLGQFPVLVPAADPWGNGYGGVRHPWLAAPLATFTPWSTRGAVKPGGASPEALDDFRGMILPLPACDGPAGGRPEAPFAHREAYTRAVNAAIREAVADRLLLAEEADGTRASALALHGWWTEVAPGCDGAATTR